MRNRISMDHSTASDKVILNSAAASNNDYGTLDKDEGTKTRLKKEIGLLEGIGVIVGAIIGSGLFISPKGIVESAGSVGLSLIIWALSGLISTVGAICYVELGTTYPSSGADYHYLFVAFGELPAFLYIWTMVLIFIPVNYAILALVSAQYIILPMLSPSITYCADAEPQSAVRLLAGVLLFFVIFINCYDVKITARMQNVFSVAKVGALLVIVVAGAVAIANGRTENFQNAFENSNYSPGKIALAFYSGIYAFGGANSLNYITEELKEPNKNLPRAIYASMSVITVIYILVNVAYFSVLSPAQMIAAEATAVAFAEDMLGWWKWTIPVFVAISSFGGLSVGIMISARMLFVSARHGHFPQMLALIKLSRLTPTPALVFTGILTFVYLYVSEIYTLINYAGFIYSVTTAAVIGALLYMRWKQPQIARPIKINVILPTFYLIVSIFLLILPMYVAPWEAVIGFAIVLTGIPVYFLVIRRKEQPKAFQNFTAGLTIIIQKLFMAVPED